MKDIPELYFLQVDYFNNIVLGENLRENIKLGDALRAKQSGNH